MADLSSLMFDESAGLWVKIPEQFIYLILLQIAPFLHALVDKHEPQVFLLLSFLASLK